MNLLSEMQHMCDGSLVRISPAVHHTDLRPDSHPTVQHPHPAGLKIREHEGPKTDQMLKEGVTETAVSEWASTVKLAPNKIVRLRFCADYRRLNKMSISHTYAPPRKHEGIHSL